MWATPAIALLAAAFVAGCGEPKSDEKLAADAVVSFHRGLAERDGELFCSSVVNLGEGYHDLAGISRRELRPSVASQDDDDCPDGFEASLAQDEEYQRVDPDRFRIASEDLDVELKGDYGTVTFPGGSTVEVVEIDSGEWRMVLGF